MKSYFEDKYESLAKSNEKEVTYKILKTIYLHNSSYDAALAGGAIRDWRIHENLSDLDFFVSFRNLGLDSAIALEAVLIKALPYSWTLKSKDYASITDIPIHVYESHIDNLDGIPSIKSQIIFIPYYWDVKRFVETTFDFDINKGMARYDHAKDQIVFDTPMLDNDLNNQMITFNLTDCLEHRSKSMSKIPERSERFQKKLSNFQIRIL